MKSKYLILLIIVSCIKTTCVFCQSYNFVNIIKNNSFEDGTDNSKPDYIAQTGFLQYWSDNLITITGANTISYLHSPEWFKDSYGFINMVEYNPPPQQIHVHANSGNCYVGMGYGELIQQKLSNNNKFNEGITYYLSMHIRPVVNPVYSYNGYFGYANWSNYVNLKVYAAKNEITYKNNKIEDICTGTYSVLKDGIFQDILTIADFPISLIDYSQGTWHKIETNFIAPNENYRWIAIELTEYPSYCNAYLLIDDVVIAEGCINGCSSTAGPYNIIASGSHTATVPFTVHGLKNISHVKLEIFTSNSQDFIHPIEINNPPDKISWDGKNANGTEVSQGAYTYEINLTNDCGVKTIGGNFSKINASTEYTIEDYEYYNHNSVSKPPLPECCEDFIDIQNQNIVQDKTIGTSDPLLYKAEIRITAGPNVFVKAESDVVFEAGDMIVLNAGFTVEAGANFTAMIEPCIDLTNKNMMTENNNNWNYNEYSDLLETNKFEQVESFSENNFFSIHPNPFNNSFTITLNQTEDSETEIYLTNTFGRKVLQIYSGQLEKGQHAIEVSDASLPSGMYFCIMQTPTQRKVLKVVKM